LSLLLFSASKLKLNRSMYSDWYTHEYGNSISKNWWGNPEHNITDRCFRNNLTGFQILWSIWSIVIFPHQIVVSWPDYGVLLVETGLCLCHAPASSVFFVYYVFYCINLYGVAISRKLCFSISNRERKLQFVFICRIIECVLVICSLCWTIELKTITRQV